MTSESDAETVEDLRADSTRAFENLMRKYGTTVYRYAWAVADSPEQVEDAVQDTFLTLWRRRRHIPLHGTTLLPWLLTTCRYTLLNANRARRRLATVPLESVAHTLAVNEDPHSAADDLRWVRQEIADLPVTDRLLIEACLVRGQSYEEASIALGIAAPTARKRMQRIRERLRAAETKGES